MNMDRKYYNQLKRCEIEDVEKWRKLVDKVPWLKFPEDCEVRIIPPFGGAIVRFLVKRGDKRISVYLDVYENLGYYGRKPYWEMYPGINGTDVDRFDMNDTDGLMKAISQVLDNQNTD